MLSRAHFVDGHTVFQNPVEQFFEIRDCIFDHFLFLLSFPFKWTKYSSHILRKKLPNMTNILRKKPPNMSNILRK